MLSDSTLVYIADFLTAFINGLNKFQKIEIFIGDQKNVRIVLRLAKTKYKCDVSLYDCSVYRVSTL